MHFHVTWMTSCMTRTKWTTLAKKALRKLQRFMELMLVIGNRRPVVCPIDDKWPIIDYAAVDRWCCSCNCWCCSSDRKTDSQWLYRWPGWLDWKLGASIKHDVMISVWCGCDTARAGRERGRECGVCPSSLYVAGCASIHWVFALFRARVNW